MHMTMSTDKTAALKALNLELRDDDEPLHGRCSQNFDVSFVLMSLVLDLPQLYQKPPLDMLLAILELLDLPPASFASVGGDAAGTVVHPDGVTDYLTKIIASPLSWLSTEDAREAVWDLASQRLSQRSGRTAMSKLTRTFCIPLSSDAIIDIALHEPALTEDNLGLKTWSSSYVLAKKLHILKDIHRLNDRPVLELGAGTGLVGLAAAAVWHTDVILTDLTSIVQNLAQNVEANQVRISANGGSVAAGVLDWASPEILHLADVELGGTPRGHHHAKHKVTTILAADPIYSPDHPRLLVNAVTTWLDSGERRDIARLILAYPIREAYLPQIADLKSRLNAAGLAALQQGEELTRDDWAEDVRVCWSVWGWR